MRCLSNVSLLVVVAVLGLASVAGAVTINVDIQGQRNDGGPGGTDAAGSPVLYSGTGPVGGTFIALGANSQTTLSSPADLADTVANGNADFLTVSDSNLAGTGISFSVSGVGADNASGAPSSSFSSLVGDYFFYNDGSNNFNATPAFQFGGLQPGTTADLYFYNQAGSVSISGYSSTTGPGASPYNTSQTIFFDDVLVGPSGTITGNFGGGGVGVFGGFTIVGTTLIPAPEPSSMVLLLGGVCLSRLRRQRAKNSRRNVATR